MNKTVTFVNAKGGTAKTTSCSAIGSALAKDGAKVLLVDLDQQRNLTQMYTREEFSSDIYTAMMGGDVPEPFQIRENLYLLPGSENTNLFDVQMLGAGRTAANMLENASRLKEVLKPFKRKYDYILIDVAPAMNLSTINALTASTHYVVPMQLEMMALSGLAKLTGFVENVRNSYNSRLKLAGILITRYEKNNLAASIEQLLKNQFGEGSVFSTKIRKAIVTAETPAYLTDVVDYAPGSTTAHDYTRAANELREKE